MLTKTSRVTAATAAAVLAVVGPLQLSASAAQSKGAHPAGSAPTFTVLASGLDNPRGLAWSQNHLYLAEAGHGGTDCPTGAVGPEGGPLCVGKTGSLDIIAHGAALPVLHNLISLANLPGGVASVGIAGVAATKLGVRVVFNESVLGLLAALPHGSSLTAENSAAARRLLGRTATLTPHLFQVLADPGDEDYTWSAIHQDLNEEFPDADPNALAILGGTTYVADAGSNTLDAISDNGIVKQVAYFSDLGASNAVPTCVAIGPDHNVYVGVLAPGTAPGGGNVYKYVPKTHRTSVWRTGFNPVNGCGFDSKGNFYAVEFQANGFNPGPTGNPAGDIVKISPHGNRTVIGAGKLFFPSGFAADHAGNIYVSNWSIMTATPASPGGPTGQVVKIRP